ELVEVMHNLILVLNQLVNARLVEQRLADDLGGGLAVDVEKGLMIQVVNFDHGGVEPDRVDDSQVVDLVLRNHPGADRVEDAVRDRRLHGSHQDVGMLLVLHGDLAHHDGGRANLDIAAQDGEDPGMTLDLIADQVRQGVADRTGQLADDDLRLGTDDPPSLRPVPHPSAVGSVRSRCHLASVIVIPKSISSRSLQSDYRPPLDKKTRAGAAPQDSTSPRIPVQPGGYPFVPDYLCPPFDLFAGSKYVQSMVL